MEGVVVIRARLKKLVKLKSVQATRIESKQEITKDSKRDREEINM
jgi:hypothetical protein